MSSNDGKMGSGPQSKLDIEAFRNHLLNYRYVLFACLFFECLVRFDLRIDSIRFWHSFFSYRSKANESELDVTDHFVDLDSSFKRMLDEKRQMTNKENAPPAAVDAMIATAINPPEKPLRKDLLKERKYKCTAVSFSVIAACVSTIYET